MTKNCAAIEMMEKSVYIRIIAFSHHTQINMSIYTIAFWVIWRYSRICCGTHHHSGNVEQCSSIIHITLLTFSLRHIWCVWHIVCYFGWMSMEQESLKWVSHQFCKQFCIKRSEMVYNPSWSGDPSNTLCVQYV